MCQICSKLTIHTPERRQWCRSGFFNVNLKLTTKSYCPRVSVVDFEQVNTGLVESVCSSNYYWPESKRRSSEFSPWDLSVFRRESVRLMRKTKASFKKISIWQRKTKVRLKQVWAYETKNIKSKNPSKCHLGVSLVFFFFKILYEDSFQKLIDKFVYLYYLL